MKWKNTDSPVKKTFRAQQSGKKVMFRIFWDMKWPFTFNFLEKGATVNSVSYYQLLWQNLLNEPRYMSQSLSVYLPNPSAQTRCNTRSISQWSLRGLNSEVSFSQSSYNIKVKEPSLPNYLSFAWGRMVGFILSPRLLACSSHRSISFPESMPPPRDSVTHWPINWQSALIPSSSQELSF